MQVVAPADDVDPFAGQLVDDVLDAIAADADAGADRVDPLVGAAHGDLAAISRLAGHGPQFDHAVGDFGDFLLEEALDELGPGAAENDLHAAADFADFEDGGPDAFVGVVRFAGDLLAAGEDRLDVVELDGGRAPS